MQPTKGLIERKSGKLDEIIISDIPYDLVLFRGNSGGGTYVKRGTYEDSKDFVRVVDSGFTVHMVGVAWFKDLQSYYSFVTLNMRDEVTYEVWYDPH